MIRLLTIGSLLCVLLPGCTFHDSDLSEFQQETLKMSSDNSIKASHASEAAMDECDKSLAPFEGQASHDLSLDARARIFQPCIGSGKTLNLSTECVGALADEAEVLDVKHGTSYAAGIRIDCTNAADAEKTSKEAFQQFFDTAKRVTTPPVAPRIARAPAPMPVYQRQQYIAEPFGNSTIIRPWP